ncbi:MAG: hypothetical protein QMD53_06590 [Actinomycetota bacterium]|nr:hypothetical protein [Actinomycetota bacterium]
MKRKGVLLFFITALMLLASLSTSFAYGEPSQISKSSLRAKTQADCMGNYLNYKAGSFSGGARGSVSTSAIEDFTGLTRMEIAERRLAGPDHS